MTHLERGRCTVDLPTTEVKDQADQSQSLSKGSQLCTQCGLCCTGALHHFAVLEPDELEFARELGLTLRETKLLTPQLRLRALPDFLARFVLWLGNKLPHNHPIVPSMLGSIALQQCLQAGWIEYRWLVFEKK